MNLSDLPRQLMKFVGNNSPAILTGVGAVGVLTTAFLTGKATFRMSKEVADRNWETRSHHEPELTGKEIFQEYWKLYIPSAVAGFATVTAIICSNRIEYRRAAAVAAAYAISEKGWQEYKEKIIEKLGPKREQAARDEKAQDVVTNNPPTGQVLIMSDNDVLCCDMWSRRYFRSTMEKIKTAMVNVNFQVVRHDYASLTSFYDELGLEPTTESDNIGWNTDVPLDLIFSHALTPDNQPCLTFEFRAVPFRY